MRVTVWMVIWCAVVLAGYASAAESPPPLVGSLQVLAPPVEVAIDPQSNSGSTVLELKNVGEKDIEALPLRAGDFVSTVTKRKLGTRLAFAAGSDTVGTVAYALDLAAGKTVALKLLATGVWDAGEAKAPVFVDGKLLLEVSARKQPVPFNVKLATGKEPVAIDWDSKRLVLRLENGDALNYSFNWRLLVDGAPLPNANGAGVLPASGSSQIEVAFAEDRFPDWSSGFFRAKPVAGTLVIDYVDATDPRQGPQRRLPVPTSLERHQATTRTSVGGIFIFFVLLLGGVASLLLNHSLPNATLRVGLRGQLGALSVKAKALGASIPSMLRTELRVRPLELTQRVDAEHSFYPGAVDIFAGAAREASILERRLGLVAKIDECLGRAESMGSDGPPELLHDGAKRLKHALRPLSAAAPDAAALSTVEQTIAEVEAQLARIEDEDAALRATVLERAKTFWQTWDTEWARLLAIKPAPDWFTPLEEQMRGFVAHARQCFSGSGPADESLAGLDTALTKLKLMARYVRICEVATAEQKKRFDGVGHSDLALPQAAQRTQRQRFFECLSGIGARAVDQAYLVLKQAEQGIFVAQIVEQLQHGKFRLQAEPQSDVHALDPVRFTFVFQEDKFNGAAAREKLDCVWMFEHEHAKYEEHGWEAWQAFWSDGDRTITVEIRRNGQPIVPAKDFEDGKHLLKLVVPVKKRYVPWVRQRTQIEIIQLTVALVVTMAALVSGAREQLDKLSFLSSLVAIFALGFGADVVKNIISRRPSAAPPAA